MRRLPTITAIWSLITVTSMLAGHAHVAHASDDKALLRVRLVKGETFRYALSSTTSQAMTVAMNDITSESTSQANLSMIVNDATLDHAGVTATMSDVASTVRVRGMDDLGVSRDTTMRMPQFEGLTLRFSIDQFGRASKLSTSLDGTASSFVASLKILDRLSTHLPKDPLAVGDTWTVTLSDTSAAPTGSGDVHTSATMRLTYKGLRDTMGLRCWVIEGSSMSMTQEGQISTNGIDLELEGSGQTRNVTYLDTQRGMVVISTGSLEMQTQMSLSGQQSMVVPVATTMQFRMTRVVERK